MNGYGSHTYSFINANDERFWVKFHFKTMQGIKNFMQEEADKIAGTDPDWATRDLFERIEKGDFPKWELSVQIMPELEAEKYKWNPFDLTKVWPLIKFQESLFHLIKCSRVDFFHMLMHIDIDLALIINHCPLIDLKLQK